MQMRCGQRGFDVPGQQRFELLHGAGVRQSLEQVREVGMGFNAVRLCALCRTPDYAERCSHVQPTLGKSRIFC
jgi:hypothetical protein